MFYGVLDFRMKSSDCGLWIRGGLVKDVEKYYG